MPTLLDHLADYKQTYAAVQREKAERQKVIESDAYAELQLKMTEMLMHIPDSSEELALDREALLKAMNAEGVTTLEGCEVKTRTSRSVDVRAVLEAVGGDIDALMLVSTVSQKNLDQFCKDNPDYKRDLRRCIREEGVKVVDVIPLEA